MSRGKRECVKKQTFERVNIGTWIPAQDQVRGGMTRRGASERKRGKREFFTADYGQMARMSKDYFTAKDAK